MAGDEGGQKLDGKTGAHTGAGVDDVDGDVAGALKLAQVALHGAAGFAQGLHEVCDGDLRRDE